MTHPQHFLFAMMVAGSIQTVYYNLKQTIAKRPGVRSSWLPLEGGTGDGRDRNPLPGSWRRTAATWWHLRKIQHQDGRIDAAFVLDRCVAGAPWVFFKRVPFVLSTDLTPALLARQRESSAEFARSPVSGRFVRWMTRRAYLGAYHILPWSGLVKESLVRDYGIPEERMTVLPPGINLHRWPVPERRPDPAAGRPRPFIVLHVGADFQEKGGDVVLELARDPEFHDVEFHCVTPQEVTPVTPNVVVHRDLKPNSEGLKEVYRHADVLLLPTRVQTFSLVALEAMASCLPVIISDVGSSRDIVVDGHTGFIVPPDDLAAIRDRLRRLRTDPVLRARMGQQGRERVEDQFSLQRHVEALIRLLSEASRSRRREHAA